MKIVFYKKLYWQVLIGVSLGILVGYLEPRLAIDLKPLGDGFIRLIKMMMAPIIFCTIVVGMASMSDIKKMGKMGAVSILYFEILTTIALFLGLVVMNIFPVGLGMNVDVAGLDASSIKQFTSQKPTGFVDLLMNIIPHAFLGAFAMGEPLQVLFLAVLFGTALQSLGGKETVVYQVIDKSSDVFFKIIEYLMKLAPIGAFGAMAYTVGKFGMVSLVPLFKFVLLFWATAAFFSIVVFGAILAYYKISIFQLFKLLKEEIFIVLGTGSSEVLFPRLVLRLQEFGIKKETVGLVLPAGMSFNLDGTCLYFTMAALFLAQATNTALTWDAQLTLFLILLISSKGANAIYGSAFVILSSTLASVGSIPVESMAIILGVDRFLAMARAAMNMIGNCVATICIENYMKEK